MLFFLESSGCVRVHNVEGLVAWILRDAPGWSLERVLSMKQSGEQADVKLAKPMPVYFVYISAWSTPRYPGEDACTNSQQRIASSNCPCDCDSTPRR